MTLKVAVELTVFPALVLEKVRVIDLYAVSRGTGLGGALPDEVVLHENVVVAVELVELEELFVVELEVETDEEALFEEDEEEATEELDVLRAKYAPAPATTITIMMIAAITV